MTLDPSPHLSDAHVRLFTVDAGPWMSCDECFDRLDEYVDRSATATDEWLPAMASHLTGCLACREEVESLLLLLAEAD
jgi:hypothetical protein